MRFSFQLYIFTLLYTQKKNWFKQLFYKLKNVLLKFILFSVCSRSLIPSKNIKHRNIIVVFWCEEKFLLRKVFLLYLWDFNNTKEENLNRVTCSWLNLQQIHFIWAERKIYDVNNRRKVRFPISIQQVLWWKTNFKEKSCDDCWHGNHLVF